MSRMIALTLLSAAFVVRPVHASQLRARAGSYELQVLNEGQPIRSFWHNGETWLLGQLGERYTLRVLNHSGRRIEAVVSVDGRDVVDGQPGDANKRGYLVPAYGSVDIDGWRISRAQAAAFRFSSVANSYAQRTGSGREVGVIGVAVFEERPPPVVYQPPVVMPYPRGTSSCCENADAAGGGRAAAPPPTTSPAPARQQSMPDAPSDALASGMAEKKAAGPSQHSRPGLGTEYGEAVDSYITETTFDRASSRPNTVIGCRYNDREGLIALGVNVDGLTESAARRTADPFPVVDRGFAPPPAGWRE